MAKQYRIQRKIATVPITAGGFVTVDLPRGYDYEALILRISASVAVSVAVVTSVRAEAPCQAVSRVEIVADGKNNLYSAPFWACCLGNVSRYLTASGARATTPPSGVAVATYAVEAIGVVDFATVDGVRPKDSNFRTRGLQLFQLRLTFGAAVDMVVQGGATVAYSGSPTVDVFSAEVVEETDANGNFQTSPVAIKKVSYQEIALASSNANQENRIPAGNLIRSVLVRTDGATTAGEPSAAVLNNLQLTNGVDVRVNLTGPQLRAKNNADFGQVTAGYYIADVTRKGPAPIALADCWDVSLAAEPKIITDVTGGANVKMQVVTTEYIPIGSLS